ncbi:hypothetical protein EDD11_003314 [Mortierella claussenii]|nr:hypothetical protein EDD11_003314 [Mortierella claussenii]
MAQQHDNLDYLQVDHPHQDTLQQQHNSQTLQNTLSENVSASLLATQADPALARRERSSSDSADKLKADSLPAGTQHEQEEVESAI